MNRLVPLVLTGLLVAACGDSTTSDGQAPAGSAGSGSQEITPGSVVTDATTDGSTPTGTETAETLPTEPSAGAEPTGSPVATQPTEPPAATEPTELPAGTEPAAPDPTPQQPTPTNRVVRFFAGDDRPGAPWAPIGHWDGAGWRELEFTELGELQPLPPSPITSVQMTTLDLPDGPDAVISGLVLGVEKPYCVGDEAGPLIAVPRPLPDTAVSTGFDAVAVTADWPLQPRPVRQVGLEVPEYAEIGAALLPDPGVTADDGTVVQAVRVDLDGDDVEEVLVTYEHQEAGPFGGDGDFSSIYVRYPSADGTVVDEQLVSFTSTEPVDFPTPGRYTLAAVADLNGDGVMEVMVRDVFWEAGGMQVFALVDGRLARVAGGGCGV